MMLSMSLKNWIFAIFCAFSLSEAANLPRRRLALESIAGYVPTTDVTDHLNIDLDLQMIHKYLNRGHTGFEDARRVYEEGAFSRCVALVNVPNLTKGIDKRTEFSSVNSNNDAIKLFLSWPVKVGNTSLQLEYEHCNCNVGGLKADDQILDGCLLANGTLTLTSANGGSALTYQYVVSEDNINTRTVQALSIEANFRMRPKEDLKEAYYPSFKPMVDYYGQPDYSDTWINAAFESSLTDFDLNRGDGDFYSINHPARSEAIKKAMLSMSVWMYVLREVEEAIQTCRGGCDSDYYDDPQDCEDTILNNVDEAVAYYTGSLVGSRKDAIGDVYYMPYSLANRRCQEFKTCGANGNELDGNSRVNIDLFQTFETLRTNVAALKCIEAEKNRKRIIQLMTIPLVQSNIFFAEKNAKDFTASELDVIEGATFAAALLPLVHACSGEDAEVIYANMNTQEDTPDFEAVLAALQSNYDCLGVTCADIGGVIDTTTGNYKAYAAPCTSTSQSGTPDTTGSTSSSDSSGSNAGLAVGLTFAGLAVVGLSFVWCKYCRKKRNDIEMETKATGFGDEDGDGDNTTRDGDGDITTRDGDGDITIEEIGDENRIT